MGERVDKQRKGEQVGRPSVSETNPAGGFCSIIGAKRVYECLDMLLEMEDHPLFLRRAGLTIFGRREGRRRNSERG